MNDPIQKIQEIETDLKQFDQTSAKLDALLGEIDAGVKDIEKQVSEAEQVEKDEASKLTAEMQKELDNIFEE